MPTRYDQEYRRNVRPGGRVKGQLRQQRATAKAVAQAAGDLSDAANMALYPRRYIDEEMKHRLRESPDDRAMRERSSQIVSERGVAGKKADSNVPTQAHVQAQSARGTQRSHALSSTTRNLNSAPNQRRIDSVFARHGANADFLPAGEFPDIEKRVASLNRCTQNAFTIGTLTFNAFTTVMPEKPKQPKRSRYYVSPRHPYSKRHNNKVDTKTSIEEAQELHRSPGERRKEERIHAAIVQRRIDLDVDGTEAHAESVRKNKRKEELMRGIEELEHLNSIEKQERLSRMRAEQDRLNRKKGEIRARRVERQRMKMERRLEMEKRENAAVKLQGLCRGRRDRIRTHRMREQRRREHDSSRRIQAIHRGRRGRARAKERRERDAATRRIQSIHRGRQGRKMFQEQKDRDMATRKIQSLHRGRKARREFQHRRDRETATRKIQSLHRGRKARREFQHRRDRETATRKIQALHRGRKGRERARNTYERKMAEEKLRKTKHTKNSRESGRSGRFKP